MTKKNGSKKRDAKRRKMFVENLVDVFKLAKFAENELKENTNNNTVHIEVKAFAENALEEGTKNDTVEVEIKAVSENELEEETKATPIEESKDGKALNICF